MLVVAVFRAAALAALAASVAFAAGLLLSWATLEAIPRTIGIAAAYEMFLEVATVALVDKAIVVGWVSAVIALSIAVSVTGRAQEWI